MEWKDEDKLDWARTLAKMVGKCVTPAAPYETDPRACNHKSEGWLLWEAVSQNDGPLTAPDVWALSDEWFPTMDAVISALRKLHDEYLDEEEAKYKTFEKQNNEN